MIASVRLITTPIQRRYANGASCLQFAFFTVSRTFSREFSDFRSIDVQRTDTMSNFRIYIVVWLGFFVNLPRRSCNRSLSFTGHVILSALQSQWLHSLPRTRLPSLASRTFLLTFFFFFWVCRGRMSARRVLTQLVDPPTPTFQVEMEPQGRSNQYRHEVQVERDKKVRGSVSYLLAPPDLISYSFLSNGRCGRIPKGLVLMSISR